MLEKLKKIKNGTKVRLIYWDGCFIDCQFYGITENNKLQIYTFRKVKLIMSIKFFDAFELL